MPFRSRNIGKEMGVAFAVLALYVLTLLAPLHQSAGLQRDLAALGFETVASWSICAPLAQDEQGDKQPTAIKCAASGIAKHELAAIEPASIDIGVLQLVAKADYGSPALIEPLALPHHVGQSRAPPMTV